MEQKKQYRTFHFENSVAWKSGFRRTLSASGHPAIEIGNPPAFKGTPDVWCPEDLLIGALNACLMLTFLYQMSSENWQVSIMKAVPKAPWSIKMGNIASLRLQSNLAFL
jgi:organic hydroperoxide reductase OsmC/OhrA